MYGAGVGMDSAWEKKKLETRKLFENSAESTLSSALSRCSSGTLCWAGFCLRMTVLE